jgi:ribosome-associated translation inhibitor RaiA
MELTITDLNIELDNQNKARIRQKVSRTFNKICDHIQKINLTINDINGPKGGKDKRCRIVIHTKGIPDIVITDSQKSIGSAVNIALTRARVTLLKKLKRKQKNMPTNILKDKIETIED